MSISDTLTQSNIQPIHTNTPHKHVSTSMQLPTIPKVIHRKGKKITKHSLLESSTIHQHQHGEPPLPATTQELTVPIQETTLQSKESPQKFNFSSSSVTHTGTSESNSAQCFHNDNGTKPHYISTYISPTYRHHKCSLAQYLHQATQASTIQHMVIIKPNGYRSISMVPNNLITHTDTMLMDSP